jgi:hypothetical protein
MPDRGDLRCSIGLHRWTIDDRTVVTCFRCHKEWAAGKAIRCRLGLHRWYAARPKDDRESYAECFFCGKHGEPSGKFPTAVIVLSVAAVVVGIVLVLTMGTLLGAALVTGGVGGLGFAMIPGLVDRFTSWLGSGTFRRW